ncbi:MAG: hypothetical protein ABEJ31_15000 [Haloarculaceae archaeon]
MTDTSRHRAVLVQWWIALDSGWQAVLLGSFAVAIVLAGVTIPW